MSVKTQLLLSFVTQKKMETKSNFGRLAAVVVFLFTLNVDVDVSSTFQASDRPELGRHEVSRVTDSIGEKKNSCSRLFFSLSLF